MPHTPCSTTTSSGCFREINALRQHAAILPNSGDEAYGRRLAGLDLNNEIV